MCDTLVSVHPDRVLFAKNSDRDPNEAQVVEWHPPAGHGPGAVRRCTYIEVPQVRATLATVVCRPFWMWGAEMGVNEAGVAIGNEAVFTTAPVAETGLLGMDLLRLALERAESAVDAVEVMTTLLEAHGQGGGAGHEDRGFRYHNSFVVADGVEAWVLETADRAWATEQVAAGGRSISNGLTIAGFAEEWADRDVEGVNACVTRRHVTQPAAERATSVADLAHVLRRHAGGGAAPVYDELNGAMAGPCMHAGGGVVNSQTTGSLLAELRPGVPPAVWVTATAAPCTSLFKPVQVDTPVDVGPTPDDRADDASLWWRHERFHRTVMTDPAGLMPLFEHERDALEAVWFTDPVDGAEAFAVGDSRLARWEDRVSRAAPVVDPRPAAVADYWRAADDRARNHGVGFGVRSG